MGISLLFTPFSSFQAEAKDNSVVDHLKTQNQFHTLGTTREELFSDQMIVVKYSKQLSTAEHKKAGGTVIKTIPSLKYVVVKVNNKKKLQETIQKYQKNKKVVSVSLSPKYTLAGMLDPKVNKQYMHSILNTEKAQKLAGDREIKIAIIDTGIDRNHPELKGKIIYSTNILNPMNPTVADMHGTHVAGIIAAEKNNGIGGYGINPNVKILSFDVFDGDMYTYDYAIASAILEAVDKGARVINISIQGYSPSNVLKEAIEQAINKGVVVIAAAGNLGSDSPIYPANYEGVISVGAINKKKKLSTFSSYGASTDIVAPGEDIYAPYYDPHKGSIFGNLSGTSMAAPVVTGVTTLLLSKHPKLTPEEVEYILEKTATDLGEKGFDEKYGSGLINPVEALSFNVSKVPSFVKEVWGKKEILEKAQQITAPKEIIHSFTKPSEQKWVKLSVKKGEYIQASLTGSAKYDYKLNVHFYGKNENEEKLLEVNETNAGKPEGILMEAPFSGTVAIGVKDVNGSYDDSLSKQSKIILKVEKYKDLPKDESTLEEPINIERLPYNKGNFYLIHEEGDDDYFLFTSDKDQLVNISVSGIPGVNLSVSVYNKSSLFFPDVEELPMNDEEKSDNEMSPTDENLVEDLPNEDIPMDEMPNLSIDDFEPLYTSNMNGVGEGETLSFKAKEGEEYYIRVTNKNTFFDLSFSSIDLLMTTIITLIFEQGPPPSSAIPYKIIVESKVIPDDEDNFSSLDYPYREDSTDDSEFISQLKEKAVSMKLGSSTSGYLQDETDQDWYQFKTKNAGVYQFEVPIPTQNIPYIQLYEVLEDEEDGEKKQYLSFVAELNIALMDNGFVTGLKGNKQYFLSVQPNWNNMQIPYDGYKIVSKQLLSDLGDANEDNDTPEDAKNITEAGVTGNFSTLNDIDTFYFTAKSNATYGVKFSRANPSKKLKDEFDDLLAPIYGLIAITEDSNKNHKIDDNESERTTYLLKANENGTTTGSFKAKKGMSYFITVYGIVDSYDGISLWPYHLKIASVVKIDEDASSIVKNNTPSKPIALKKVKEKYYRTDAYFNSGFENGDTDWFVYEAKQAEQVEITLDAGELDGVMEIYKDGKRVAKSDYYGNGDSEVILLKLSKGKYYIKVKEANGLTSITPYSVILRVK